MRTRVVVWMSRFASVYLACAMFGWAWCVPPPAARPRAVEHPDTKPDKPAAAPEPDCIKTIGTTMGKVTCYCRAGVSPPAAWNCT